MGQAGHNAQMERIGQSPAPPLVTHTTRTYHHNTVQFGAIRTYKTRVRAHTVALISGSPVGRVFAPWPWIDISTTGRGVSFTGGES